MFELHCSFEAQGQTVVRSNYPKRLTFGGDSIQTTSIDDYAHSNQYWCVSTKLLTGLMSLSDPKITINKVQLIAIAQRIGYSECVND